MKFLVAAETDCGIVKDTNQDSILFKHADSSWGEVLMAIVCDGMGGLAKGELASATLIRHFNAWFEERLSKASGKPDLYQVKEEWLRLLIYWNQKIFDYGTAQKLRLGTTFTGVFFWDQSYLIIHIGDSRVYHMGDQIRQMTTDHTFVAREVRRGTMTPEQARVDKRRNMLIQCIGASEKIMPEILMGRVMAGTYLLCSDGFRNKAEEQEIYQALRPEHQEDCERMHQNVRALMEELKSRKEKDNISAILIKAEEKETRQTKDRIVAEPVPEPSMQAEEGGRMPGWILRIGRLFSKRKSMQEMSSPVEEEKEYTETFLEDEVTESLPQDDSEVQEDRAAGYSDLSLLSEGMFVHTDEYIV